MATNRPRRPTNRVTTRKGRVIKVNRSMGERFMAMREGKSLRRVQRLRGLPKSRIKRIAWKLQPKRLAEYWFSRDGAIMGLKVAGIFILIMFIFTIGIFAYFRKDLPDISVTGNNIGGSISYYDRTGQTLLWQDYNAVKRVPIKGDEISQYLKDATVAIEDRDFYNHRGFDIKGIARAAVNDITHRGSTQGGSTITQQLVKLNLDWTQQRSITRKVKELILAVELERSYTKADILTGYLNAAPYGGVDQGVQAAASDYFNEKPKDLTLAQAAMLAAIPKSPTLYSPYSGEYFDKQLFIDRQHYVLDVMVQTHKITKAQADNAKKEDVLAEVHPQQTKYAGIKAPYFVLAAKKELDKKFACSTGTGCIKPGGWKVVTTLDMGMQQVSEDRVAANLPNVQRNGGDEEATVTEDVQTGQMMALVGGTNFNDPDHGNVNYAQWPISPGSSIKPYDYSTLIDNNNAGAGSVLYDVVGPVPGYPCTNKALPPAPGANCLWDFDRKSPGPMTIRYALGGSRNIPAVKATVSTVPGNVQASIDKRDALANAMMDGDVGYHCYQDGVNVATAKASDQVQCYPSSGIGDGAYLHLDQHLNGLSTLGRLGQAIPATYILQLYNAGSNKPFYQWTAPKPKQVMKPQTAYIMDNMLSDPNASYFPAGTKFQSYKGWNIAVKTGTTNDNYDGLMMAWTTKYAVGTWVGYHTRTKALSGQMENLTMPVTRNIIESALDSLHTTPVNWQAPSGIQTLPAFHSSIAYSSQVNVPATDIFPSWYKPKTASSQTVSIDKVSNKTSTSCTPSLAKQTAGGNTPANLFSIDEFYPPGASASTTNIAGPLDTDDVHSCSDTLPSVASVFVDGQDVTDGGSANCTGSCTITATPIEGTHALDDPGQYPQFPGTLNLLVNGQVVQTKHVTASGAVVQFDALTGSGSETIAVQVVDSVLYDSTSPGATINFAAAPTGPTAFTATRTGNTLSWAPVAGATSYKVYWTNPSGSASTAATTYGLPGGSKGAYAEAYDSANNKIAVSNTTSP